MCHTHLFLGSVLTAGLCGIFAVAPAKAQPDINTPPKAENPPNWNWNPGGRAENRAIMRGMTPLPLTPEQLRQFTEQQAEAKSLTIKQKLTAAGFTDEALQTAVASEYKLQDIARSELQSKWQTLTIALRVNQTPEPEMTRLVKEFRDAVAKEKARRQAAATTLEAQFKISQKPALDALLMTLGITGDEAELVGQVTSNALTQLLPFGGIAGMANGGPTTNIVPHFFLQPATPGAAANGLLGNTAPLLFTPQIPGRANGAPFGNQGQFVIPIPQAQLPQLHLFEGQANAMPNPVPPAQAAPMPNPVPPAPPLPNFF